MENISKESLSESFNEDLRNMAERVQAERSDGQSEKERDLDGIRKSLLEVFGAGDDAAPVPPRPSHGQKKSPLDTTDDTQTREQVGRLIQMAVTDGISAAVNEVQKTDNRYLIDTFHDEFTHFVHEKMKEQGLL